MNEQIFRQKSLDKIRSPEELNDYVRVANPGVWLMLAAVICLMAGVCIWGIFGNISAVIKTDVRAENGEVFCYISGGDIYRIEPGMTVRFGDTEGTVTQISSGDTENTYRIGIDAEITDGIYEARIIVESMHPFSFLFN